MRGRPTLLAAGTAIVLALGVLVPGAALGQGAGTYFKFLFTPQAGLNSAYLSCGWHSGGCVGPTPPAGPALDFPAASSDAGYDVYFRSFGFKRSGGDEWVAFGTPLTRTGTLCTETMVRIRDKDASTTLGWMHYMHTYRTRSADMLMYVNQYGRRNQDVFAGMAHEPDHPENSLCVQAGYWTGPHVHEYHADGQDIIFLRDGGGCGGWYPCAPASGGPYNPQNWGADWTRIFCIDDTDCDGWADDEETHMGTDSWDSCPDGSWDAAWPPDFDNNRVVDITDAALFMTHFPSPGPGYPNWSVRFDLDANWVIDITDAGIFLSHFPGAC